MEIPEKIKVREMDELEYQEKTLSDYELTDNYQ